MESQSDPLLQFLMEMGFPRVKAERALTATGHSSVESAMEWILSHGDDEIPDATENSGGQPASASIKLPLTEEELAEQARKLEERRKQRRAEVAELERKAEIEREKARRLTGKEILDAKEKAQLLEMQRYAEERRREKEDDKKARQRVKDMIEEDRRNREPGVTKDAAPVTPTPTPTPVASSASLSSSSHTRIQIRMLDGKSVTHTFGVNEPLGAVRLFAELNRKDGEIGPFNLVTNYPKREFSDEDMAAPLNALGLVPSATLIATRKTLV